MYLSDILAIQANKVNVLFIPKLLEDARFQQEIKSI